MTIMLDVNNCGTVLQGGQGRTCAAAGVGVGRARSDAGEDHSPTNILHAAYVGALELIKSMVARGAAPDAADVLRGSTPLHWAAFGGHLDVVRWLVRTAGADADRSNNDGCTPLLFACERGHMGVAQWLVRQGGAKVNVRDNVMWQTPLHRVFLSAQRATHGANVSDVEELVLWLVESGADLTSVDRFGNHVEDTRTENKQGGLMSPSHSKLCDMIVLARQEGPPGAGAREKLRRRSSVRRKSTGDLAVQLQLSPKLEAKQRAPISRRGSRKGSNGISRGGSSRGGSSSDNSSPGGPQVVMYTGSYDNKAQGGNKQYHQRRPSCGRVVSKTPSNDSEEAELLSVSPASTLKWNGGSGGGVAAVALGAGAKMGGGSPAPAAASVGVEELEGNEEGGAAFIELEGNEEGGAAFMDKMAAIVGVRKATEGPQREAGVQSTVFEGNVVAAEEKRRLDGAGQILVERIRELATKKSAGDISQKTFLAKKKQLLEMEFLRREVDEETRRRAQGYADDEGTGILTSVGQNTPPPSPKATAEDHGFAADDDDKERVPIVIPDAEKDQRESYKASDLDRYTTIKTEGPRVFGEVPDSVKQSLAVKEALRDATASSLRQDGGESGRMERHREKRGKAKRSDYPLSPSKNKHISHDDYSGATADSRRAVGSDDVQAGSRDRSKSSSGCTCVVM